MGVGDEDVARFADLDICQLSQKVGLIQADERIDDIHQLALRIVYGFSHYDLGHAANTVADGLRNDALPSGQRLDEVGAIGNVQLTNGAWIVETGNRHARAVEDGDILEKLQECGLAPQKWLKLRRAVQLQVYKRIGKRFKQSPAGDKFLVNRIGNRNRALHLIPGQIFQRRGAYVIKRSAHHPQRADQGNQHHADGQAVAKAERCDAQVVSHR